MYSAYKLNKQGENIQPWHTAFPILNQSVVPYLVLTIALDLIYRFLRRQEVLLLPYSVVFQKQNQRKMYLYWYRSKLKEKLTQEPCFLTSLNRVVKYLNIYAQTLMGLKSPWNYRKKFVCRLSICCFWWEGIWEREMLKWLWSNKNNNIETFITIDLGNLQCPLQLWNYVKGKYCEFYTLFFFSFLSSTKHKDKHS